MKTVPLAEAATRLLELVAEVRRTGEHITVLDDDEPVAQIGQEAKPKEKSRAEVRARHKAAVAGLRELRQRLQPATEEEIRDAINEGRL